MRRFIKIACLSKCLIYLLGSSLIGEQAPLPVEGFRQVSPRIYCSGEPVGPDVFNQLASIGFKTIVSVDGKQPDQQAAEKAGLRYVHLPIGYDSVPKPVQAALKQLLETTQGPILIHCHHGKHRGPAAAAIAGMLEKSLSKEQAHALMKQAGTGAEYQGLWRDVENFMPLVGDVTPAPLSSSAKISPFVREMTRIDDTFEKLEAISPDSPDAKRLKELAVLLEEGFREAMRNTEKNHSVDMIDHLKKSLIKSQQLSSSALHFSSAELRAYLKNIKQDCRDCHKSYRN